MKRHVLSAMALALTVLAVTAASNAAAAPATDPVAQPAIDGVFKAFETHPVVALGDQHANVQENAFYIALLSDPRFARQIGNVVIETAGAAQQDTLDRYMAGETVPYAQLRKVWSDVVGWYPGVVWAPQLNFFSAVRAINQKLPADQRIRVWGGEPFIDWSKVHTRAEFRALYDERDRSPADLVKREILAKGKKTLIIYGGSHFTAPYNMNRKIEDGYPHSVFVIEPYTGSANPACDKPFEARASQWPTPALVSHIRKSWAEDLISRPGCELLSTIAEGPTPPTPEQVAAAKLRTEDAEGLNADAVLYLGPAASILIGEMDPMVFLDQAYTDELSKHYEIMVGRPFDWSQWALLTSEGVGPMDKFLGRTPASSEAAKRMAANKPEPGSEAALRKHLKSVQADQADDDSLAPDLLVSVHKDWPDTVAAVKGWGPLKTLTFSHVDNHGYDVYEVGFEHAKSTWTIHLAPDGKISSLDQWLHP
jgi:hypothetical protein